MKLLALLTSAGINIGLCALFLSLYSVLRKQPGNAGVYFGRRIAEERNRLRGAFILERFVPSPSWIMRALQCTEDEIISIGGLDAVVLFRIILFSMRIFAVAAVICIFGVLPLNYFGHEMQHVQISSASLDIFTIGNVAEGSKWLWVHCVALYIISSTACALLYFEYKHIARMRLLHVTRSTANPGHFTILVRGVPKSDEEPPSNVIGNFFRKYYASSYLCHQMSYKVGKVQKIMSSAKKTYQKFSHFKAQAEQKFMPSTFRCGLCGGASSSFHLFTENLGSNEETCDIANPYSSTENEESAAAFVFFKTRYAAVIASEILQTSNPMIWVTDLAPEPNDVYWSNLWIPYRQLWIRRIATLLASIILMFVFLIPVTFVQGLTQLDQLQQRLPFLKGLLSKRFMIQLVTGYLPSVVLQLFFYIIPPIMMLFSTLEGPISHSGRKKSACLKVLYFTIWNVFFVNVLSGSVISQLNVLSSPKDIPMQLARAVPGQATFFITYVLTSGWASLSSELLQLFALLWSFIMKYVFQRKEDSINVPSFPYHTEVPKLLLFGLLGFTCSVLAPLILPFLLVYFFLSYIVYRNQILNVYSTRYDTGGLMWPIAHNTTIFSLVLTQIIALGVFGLKESSVASIFMIPLVILTLLFNEYCRKRFSPLFKWFPAQDLIDMDREDEQSGRTEEVHRRLHLAYSQFAPQSHDKDVDDIEDDATVEEETEKQRSSVETKQQDVAAHPTLKRLPLARLRQAVNTVALLVRLQKRGLST